MGSARNQYTIIILWESIILRTHSSHSTDIGNWHIINFFFGHIHFNSFIIISLFHFILIDLPQQISPSFDFQKLPGTIWKYELSLRLYAVPILVETTNLQEKCQLVYCNSQNSEMLISQAIWLLVLYQMRLYTRKV